MKNKKYNIICLLISIILFITASNVNAKDEVYDSYKIGDIVTYNGINFYVIANSDSNQDYVTLLKEIPLTADELNKYGAGHVNRYTSSSVGTAYNNNGYGGMTYYSSETCGYPNGSSGFYVGTGCTTDYAQSEVKYAVDAWAKDKFRESDLKEDATGYKARLITRDELLNNLGYEPWNENTEIADPSPENTPSWVYNSNYWYWTMSPYNDSTSNVWYVNYNGNLNYRDVNGGNGSVRPVINLKKQYVVRR